MTQRAKVVNARDVRLGWGMNGVTMDSNGATMLKTLNCRWIRYGTETGDVTGANMKTLSSAMDDAGVFDPNPRVLWLIDGYWDDRGSYPWSSQQNNILTAMARKMPNGQPFVQLVEGPNEMGNISLDSGSVTVNGQTQCTGDPNDGVDACRDSTTRSAFVGWAQAIWSWRQNNASAFANCKIASPTILDGELHAPDNTNPGNYPANAPNGINCQGNVEYAGHHWYGGTGYASAPCGPDNNSSSGNTKTRLDLDYDGFLNGITGGSNNIQMVCSETGSAWSEGPDNMGANTNYWALDTISAGWYVMAILLDYMAMGGKRIFYYTATGNDNKGDSQARGRTGFNWFINYDYTNPICPGVFLANISTLCSLKNSYTDSSNLNDTASFNPTYSSSGFSVSGNTKVSAAGSYLIMPKSDGTTMIAVWREPFYQFNAGGSTSTVPSPDTITVNFGSSQTGALWDPTGGNGGSDLSYSSSPKKLSTFSSQQTVSFSLYASPIFIELTGVPITSAPSTPTGFALGSTTATRQTVTWTAGSGGQSNSPENYVLQIQPTVNTGTWTTFATVDTSSNSFTYYGLTPNTTYYYRIQATNSVSSSGFTSSINATTTAQKSTSTPAVIQSATFRDDHTNATSRTLSLGSVPTSGNAVYVFFNGYAGSGSNNSSSITAPSGATLISGPKYTSQEVQWCWKLTSNVTSNSFTFSNFDSSNDAGWKLVEVSNAVTQETNQGAVTSVTTTSLTWPLLSPSLSNTVRLTALSIQQPVSSVTANSSGLTVLKADTSASFHIGVLTSATSSATSPAVLTLAGATANDPDAYLNVDVYGDAVPNKVTGVSSSNLTSKATTLTWTSLGSGATSYLVEESTNSGTSWSPYLTVSGATNTANVTGLTASTSYQFRVTGYNDSGIGTPSDAVTVTTPAPNSLQLVQSAIANDNTGSGSITVSLTNAPTSGNTLVFYWCGAKTGNTGMTAGIPSSAAQNVVSVSADSNSDSCHMFWTQTVSSTTKSFTLTGYADLCSLTVAEYQGVNSIDTPTHSATLTYSSGTSGSITLPVTAPSTTPAIGVYGVGISVAPLSFGTMPSGVTLLQSVTATSSSDVEYHKTALFQTTSSVSGNQTIPTNFGTFIEGGAPMMAGIQLIGTGTTPTAPGGTTLTFGTSTTTTIPLSWAAASGTVTRYDIAYSTSSSMTNATTVSVSSGTSTTITSLSPGTTYFFTITAYNQTAKGPTSSVQSRATLTQTNAQYLKIGGKLFLLDGKIAKA